MKQHQEQKPEVIKKVLIQAKKSIESARILLDNNDPISSINLYALSLKIISENTNIDLQDEVNLSHKFQKDIDIVNLGEDKYQQNLSEYSKNLDETSMLIENHQNQLFEKYPQLFPVKSYFKKNRKKIFLSVFFLIFVFSLFKIITNIQEKNNGLWATYYSSKNFTKPFIKKIDKNINFNWKKGSPLKGFRKDGFSIRWEGFLKIPQNGEYTFYTLADDGVRLWLNDTLIINDWKSHAEKLNSTTLPLAKGLHNFKMEYFDDTSFASVKLSWKKTGTSKTKIIEPKYLLLEK